MIASSSEPSLRDRLGTSLRDNRLAAAVEVLAVVLFLALHVAGLLPTEIIPVLLLGWISLWLRRSGWRQIGMSRPASWRRTVLLGIGIGVIFNVLDWAVILPLVTQITGVPPDLGQFDSVQGNLAVLLFWLVLAWTLGAFGEEMAWRGYLFNRLGDLLGHSQAGLALSLGTMALFFGLGHAYQGITGVVEAALCGVLYGALYLASGRNLWLPIMVHGVENTTSFVLIYMGLLP